MKISTKMNRILIQLKISLVNYKNDTVSETKEIPIRTVNRVYQSIDCQIIL